MSTSDTRSFSPATQSAFAARFQAQKIVFGPVVFVCVRHAWKSGMLAALGEAGERGLDVDELARSGGWSDYALKVVLESCLSAGAVRLKEGRYQLDKLGFCFISDKMTQINLDFIHDVCYRGLADLDQALATGTPAGLKTLGDWPTLYRGLAELPEPARSSWLAFDHHYSDISFPSVMPDVFATGPRRVLDIGANTGRFSAAALAYSASVELHLVDLPQQLAVAGQALAEVGLAPRFHLHPVDMLDAEVAFPAGMDIVWMSQFLSCFSEPVIASILQRAAESLAPGGQVLVMDTFWDCQQHDIAAYCLMNTSPYFTAMASGNSKVYRSGDYLRLAEAAGLKLLTARDGIGLCHSLLRFAKA